MNTIKKAQVGLSALTLLIGVFAQGEKSTDNVDVNEIFKSMMETMPKEMKCRVDSAFMYQKSQSKQTKAVLKKEQVHISKPEMTHLQEINLNKLPESVRERVRKTMQELEQQKDQRILEFKENKSQK